MPNSLTMNLSSALVYSTRPPVSVYGTGGTDLELRSFSREYGYRRCHFAHALRVLSGFGSGVDLPAPSTPTTLQRAFPSARGRFTPPSLHRSPAGDGMFTVSSIGGASRLSLRARLTLIRLALIRKPWSYGEGVSRPLCRYLYLHLLFQNLQHISRYTFKGVGMLPYQSRTKRDSTASVPDLCPIIIHARPLDR